MTIVFLLGLMQEVRFSQSRIVVMEGSLAVIQLQRTEGLIGTASALVEV